MVDTISSWPSPSHDSKTSSKQLEPQASPARFSSRAFFTHWVRTFWHFATFASSPSTFDSHLFCFHPEYTRWSAIWHNLQIIENMKIASGKNAAEKREMKIVCPLLCCYFFYGQNASFYLLALRGLMFLQKYTGKEIDLCGTKQIVSDASMLTFVLMGQSIRLVTLVDYKLNVFESSNYKLIPWKYNHTESYQTFLRNVKGENNFLLVLTD